MVRGWLNKEYLYLTNDVWIGGRSQYSSQSPWYWNLNTNSTAIDPSVLQPNWAPKNPNPDLQRTALQLSKSNGYLFANQAPERRLYSMLCKKKSFFFDHTNTLLTLTNQINAVDSFGAPLIGYTFLANVTHESDFTQVVGPSTGSFMSVFQRVPIDYGNLFTGKAYPYRNAFTVAVCNDLTASQIQSVRKKVKEVWMSVRQEFAQCNCFDVYLVANEKFTDANNKVCRNIEKFCLCKLFVTLFD